MTAATFPAPKAINIRYILGTITFSVLATLVLMALANLITGAARVTYETPPWALALHLATVIPALFLGAPVLFMKKGTATHKMLGRIWASLMIVTSIASFWIQGMTGSIGPIHVFSIMTLISIPWGIYCARTGNMVAHQRAMTGPYIGLIIAGLFSFVPGRLMGELAFAMI